MNHNFFSMNLDKVLKCRLYFHTGLLRIIHSLLFSYSVKFDGHEETDLIVFNTCHLKKRNDYVEYMNNFIGQCSSVRHLLEVNLSYTFTPFLFFQKIFFIIAGFKKKKNFLELVQLSQLNMLYLKIKKMELHGKAVVTFCDAHPEDNMISQMCSQLFGCNTYTLQHGYYTFSPDSINKEVYENFVSDFMLCWGDITKNNLVKIGVDERRLISFGCFKNIIKYEDHWRRNNSVLVLLNGTHNNESNIFLLSMISDLLLHTNYHILLKQHPDDKNEYFLDKRVHKITSLKEGICHSDFSIISESGVFVDLYLSKHPFFILKTPNTKPEFEFLPNIISGIELIKLLQENNPKITHVPIDSLIQNDVPFEVIK